MKDQIEKTTMEIHHLFEVFDKRIEALEKKLDDYQERDIRGYENISNKVDDISQEVNKIESKLMSYTSKPLEGVVINRDFEIDNT